MPAAAATTPAASNILGISAKSVHVSGKGRRVKDLAAGLKAKSLRYTLSRAAGSLLFDPGKAAGEQKRVCWCCRTVRSKGESVGVFRQVEGGGARFSGLATCGSVWHCPVCAAKITEARRRELDLALTAWVKQGGVVQLLTLTFPHDAEQPLADLLERFGKALQSFKNSRPYKGALDDAGREGSIRSLETTWGENGWHPHTHDLVFLRRELTPREVDILKSAWVKALMKQGLGSREKFSDMFDHALDVQDGRYAAEYVAKFGRDAEWGASAEMTKPHAKIGAIGEVAGEAHYTPFQLLAWAEQGDAKAAALFREYAEAFEGKRMLSWSPGLRKTLTGMEHELPDEMIAAHDDPAPDEERVGELHIDQLAVLLSRNRMGDFLRYVAESCWNPATAQQDIDDYIAHLAMLPKTHSSQYRKRRFIGSGFQVLH